MGSGSGGHDGAWSRRDDVASVREEAERLVSTVLAMASLAAKSLGERYAPTSTNGEVSCACPLCRIIAAVREPQPAFAAELATAVGDVAAGVAGILRTLSDPAGHRRSETTASSTSASHDEPDWLTTLGTLTDMASLAWRLARPAGRSQERSDTGTSDPWRTATRQEPAREEHAPDPWRAATRAQSARNSGGARGGEDIVDAEVVSVPRDDAGPASG